MARAHEDLGFLEQQVLLAAIRLHPDAYGVSITDEIKIRTGKEYSPGSIYAAIERLETKGYIEVRKGASSPERGGRAKSLLTVTGQGRSALDYAMNAIDALRAGVRILGAFA